MFAMSRDIPRAFFSGNRSAFALIDPTNGEYRRVLDRHGALRSGLKMHVAISYVWSDWKDNPSDRLPNWNHLQERLLGIVGPQTPPALKKETWNATSCWLDSKCINQDSEADKMYWIPRMDEVYHEAECTVLLLRDYDLTVLMEVAQGMKCKFDGKVPLAERMLGPHSCLLTQSCTILPDLSQEREMDCMRVLKSFANGTWRRRAWIFQEILLSRNYLVSWSKSDWTSLENIGVIAGLLFQKNLQEVWLEEFATWCRRVEYLRQYYETTSFSDLSDANVLQMASTLEATVSCDKYYALCGILRLKRIQYNSAHTANQALQSVIEALTKAGRLSWLYAIPPSVEESEMKISGDSMTPFILTRMDGGKLFAKTRNLLISSHTLEFDAGEVGIITHVEPFHQLLSNIKTLLEKNDFNLDNILRSSPQSEVERLKRLPDLVHRAALEIFAPLFLEPVFGDICRILSIEVKEQSLKAWIMILLLCFLDLDKYFQQPANSNFDSASISVVKSAAIMVRNHLINIQDRVVLVELQSINNNHNEPPAQQLALGFLGLQTGFKIFALEADNQLLLAADLRRRNENDGIEIFGGMIFQLQVEQMIGPVPSSLFGPFWKQAKRGEKIHLTLKIHDFDVGRQNR